MKVIISSQGTTEDAEVDPRFGRAKNFLVFDTETGSYTLLPNTQNLQAAQGAGIQAGRSVADAGAEVVLTGNCGPKAFRTLQGAGIKVFVGITGTVKQAVESFLNGQLSEADTANVEGHW